MREALSEDELEALLGRGWTLFGVQWLWEQGLIDIAIDQVLNGSQEWNLGLKHSTKKEKQANEASEPEATG